MRVPCLQLGKREGDLKAPGHFLPFPQLLSPPARKRGNREHVWTIQDMFRPICLFHNPMVLISFPKTHMVMKQDKQATVQKHTDIGNCLSGVIMNYITYILRAF